MDTRKINLGVGVLVQDPMIVMTLNLTGFPARVATRKINLGVGVLVQDPMIAMTLVQFPSDICSCGCVCFAAVVQGQGRCTGSFRAP